MLNPKKPFVYLLFTVLITASIFIFSIKETNKTNNNESLVISKTVSNIIYKISDFKPTSEFKDVRHKEIWDYFNNLTPLDIKGNISEFEIISDPNSSVVGNIKNIAYKPTEWRLKINTSIIYQNNILNKDLLKKVLVHEIGHFLTLNDSQINLDYGYLSWKNNEFSINFKQNEDKCSPNYYLQEGCSKIDSYINIFWKQFWSPIWQEYSTIQNISDSQVFNKSMSDFINKNTSLFVSQEAGFNPEEDIAESFAYFILNIPVSGNIAKEKIDFFNRYEYFKQLKQEINSNV